ncbi:hypothetical protein ACEWBU_24140, partial [Vibrio parahaemolyticus]
WTATPPFYISQPQLIFAHMPEFNPSLKGFEMVKQIEERKALAERNAKLALEQYHEQQKKFIQEWMSFLLEGKIEYEPYREAISFTNYVIDEESADFKRAFARYDRDTERVLPKHNKTNSGTVSTRTQNNPEGHYSKQSAHDAGIPSICRSVTGAIESLKRNIRIHETANSEIGTSIEHAGKLAERQRDSYLELSRAFEVIASEPKLRDELKSRLIRNETRKIPRMKKDGLRRVLKKLTKPQPHEQERLDR